MKSSVNVKSFNKSEKSLCIQGYDAKKKCNIQLSSQMNAARCVHRISQNAHSFSSHWVFHFFCQAKMYFLHLYILNWMNALLVNCIQQTMVCRLCLCVVYINSFFNGLYFLFNRFGRSHFTPYYLCNSWSKTNKKYLYKNRKFMCELSVSSVHLPSLTLYLSLFIYEFHFILFICR